MSDPEHDDHSSVDAWEDEGDDVWGNDDGVSYDRTIAQKEWDRLHENFGNAGYRDGIEEGKEGTLQQGFNQGWSEGVQYGHELGRLRGLISPLLEYIRSPSTAQQTGPLSNLKDKEDWIVRATELVKELVELDIAKAFDKAYFDDGLGPSSDKATLKNKDKHSSTDASSGCCGGGGSGSSGSSCCQSKKEATTDSDDTTAAVPGESPAESSKGCCSSNGGGGSCHSNKKNSCSSKEAEEEDKSGEWSSKPEQVVNEYRSRVRALLVEANMEALSQTV
ncbi:hypothetical protein BGX23_007853 [Mortierella sp. AD031]|nr:hypothetical protein BGX23_007853 [Mortierella sp. AD031]KAG0200362.1 hypothetical protein BGX33_011050 [Mortierella sp. NVP41]